MQEKVIAMDSKEKESDGDRERGRFAKLKVVHHLQHCQKPA